MFDASSCFFLPAPARSNRRHCSGHGRWLHLAAWPRVGRHFYRLLPTVRWSSATRCPKSRSTRQDVFHLRVESVRDVGSLGFHVFLFFCLLGLFVVSAVVIFALLLCLPKVIFLSTVLFCLFLSFSRLIAPVFIGLFQVFAEKDSHQRESGALLVKTRTVHCKDWSSP